MKPLLPLILLVTLFSGQLIASTLTVSTDLSYDPNDSTPFLQFALEESTADTVIIDYVGGAWKTGPLRLERDNLTIILEDSVVIEALPGAFDIYEPLIRIRDRENINIVGYGATLRMQRAEYVQLADSEYRHGIRLASAKNVLIEGLRIEDTGGDGIIIEKSFSPTSTQNYCENITILNCVSTNNYRQGLSIISVKNANILNCEFSETNGTLPEDGIDIEPDAANERIENVLIKGCRIFNNNGRAIQLALSNLDDNSLDVSVSVEDTYMSNNYDPSNDYAYAEIAAFDNGANGVDGFVKFENCLVENSGWTAAYARKTIESYDLIFENCVFKGISNDPTPFNNPVFFEVSDYENPVPRFGGATFTDCTIIYTQDIPFLSVIGNPSTSSGLGNVTGNFFIIHPNAVGFELGESPENVDITFELYEQAPDHLIDISTTVTQVAEPEIWAPFTIQRTTTEAIPLAVTLEWEGMATYGKDYYRHPGFVIFTKDQMTFTDSIQVIQDQLEEGEESLQVKIQESDCFDINNSDEVEIIISDDILSSYSQRQTIASEIQLFPNPATNYFQIRTALPFQRVELRSSTGQLLKTFDAQETINIHQLTSGLYWVVVYLENGQRTVRKLVVQE